jgi:hypothetical protein
MKRWSQKANNEKEWEYRNGKPKFVEHEYK